MVCYTYLIGWSKHDRWYYGVRKSNKVDDPSKDLFVKYFTSSRHVKEFIKEFGFPDIIQVRHKFENYAEGCDWEHKVLKRMNVVKEERWLNKTASKGIDQTGTHRSLETRQKMSAKRAGRKPMLGKKHSEETRLKMRLAHLGKKRPEELKIKMAPIMKEVGLRARERNRLNKLIIER